MKSYLYQQQLFQQQQQQQLLLQQQQPYSLVQPPSYSLNIHLYLPFNSEVEYLSPTEVPVMARRPATVIHTNTSNITTNSNSNNSNSNGIIHPISSSSSSSSSSSVLIDNITSSSNSNNNNESSLSSSSSSLLFKPGMILSSLPPYTTNQYIPLTVWDTSISDLELHFSENNTIARRPGSVSCYPASLIRIPNTTNNTINNTINNTNNTTNNTITNTNNTINNTTNNTITNTNNTINNTITSSSSSSLLSLSSSNNNNISNNNNNNNNNNSNNNTNNNNNNTITDTGIYSISMSLQKAPKGPNSMSIGIAQEGLKSHGSDGFGLTAYTWGLIESRSTGEGKIYANRQSLGTFRKMIVGDIFSIIYNRNVGKAWLMIYNIVEENKYYIELCQEFVLHTPGDTSVNYVVGATYCNVS
jgi:hypothetical protein